MKVYVFGNPDLKKDSLPKKLIPTLAKKFPEIEFVDADPLDLRFPQKNLVVIDTVLGIKQVTVFDNLKDFEKRSRLSLHDYDLGMELFLQQKVGKIGKLKVIGIPPKYPKQKIIKEFVEIFKFR